MAIDRPTLTTWLSNWRGAAATSAGLALTDTATGWGPALDECVRVDAIIAVPTLWQYPLGDYFGLRLIANTLDTRFDLTVGQNGFKLSQIADRVRGQLDEASHVVFWLLRAAGLVPGGAPGAVPFAGGLLQDDVTTRRNDPTLEPPLFDRQTGAPISGMNAGLIGPGWLIRYWP